MQQTKILIRLPNWLGDLVMSTAFINAVKQTYPGAQIDLITKKGIDVLLDHFPAHGKRYIFSKDKYPGLKGAWKFGKEISTNEKYDLFFCLPDSISSAVMAKATGAAKRIGYKKELRSFFLTHSYRKKQNLHRVEEYVDLLTQFSHSTISHPVVELKNEQQQKNNSIIININSEASSRRLPEEKAISIIDTVRKNTDAEIILIGAEKEKAFVEKVFQSLPDRSNIKNIAGTTNLTQLMEVMSSSRCMLTTDSGPAHVANALGTNTLVLFGAGNENNTSPYNKLHCKTIRLGQLSCEPCLNNTCKKYGVPECLLRLDENMIVHTLKLMIDT